MDLIAATTATTPFSFLRMLAATAVMQQPRGGYWVNVKSQDVDVKGDDFG